MTTNQYGSEYDQYIDGHYTDNRKPQDENLLNKVELTKDEIYKETKEKQLKELREKYNYRYTYIQEEIKSRFYDSGASSQQDYYRLLQTEYAQSLIIDFVIRQNSKEGIKKVFSTDNPNLVAEAKQINTNYGDVIEDAYNCIAGDNGIVTQNGVDSKLWKDLTKNGTDRETMDVDNISSIQIEVQYNRTDEQEVCENETTTANVKETTTSKNNVRIKKDKNSSENSFVRLLHHSKKARGNFDIIDVWFFESMEETTAIADLVDLLKYLFYLVYNKDYGVSTDEKDYIDLFNPGSFHKLDTTGSSQGGGSSELITFIAGWETPEYNDLSINTFTVKVDMEGDLYVGPGIKICSGSSGGNSWYPDITGETIYPGQTFTRDIVDKIYLRVIDSKRKIVKKVEAELGIILTQCQEDAMTSFAYNMCDAEAEVRNCLVAYGKNKNLEAFKNLFLQYNKSNGVVLGGLVKRREAEYNMFAKGIYDSTH